MNRLRRGLIALVLVFASVCGAEAQEAGTESGAPASRLFNAERWQLLTSTGEAFAGIRSESDAALVLLMCMERDRIATLTFHPAAPAGLAEPPQVATLTLDGGPALEATLTARAALDGSILFVLHDHEPGFRAAIDKLMRGRTLEVAVAQADKPLSRHQFALRGSGDAIAAVMKRCGP